MMNGPLNVKLKTRIVSELLLKWNKLAHVK